MAQLDLQTESGASAAPEEAAGAPDRVVRVQLQKKQLELQGGASAAPEEATRAPDGKKYMNGDPDREGRSFTLEEAECGESFFSFYSLERAIRNEQFQVRRSFLILRQRPFFTITG
ncbi:hypothetical protein NDU88_000721 [Pleurodeles waltl]|uniref:Uncharacterized protein n=1 Tax=Pleurodeles waltl TaxID=8319 RepID=A0AAV7TI07_PLEWA|nr:hypothetical protein NDU88_000721 [Pleurodeles waltl]